MTNSTSSTKYTPPIKINGHGHILPEPSQIPQFMKDKKLFWIDEDKKFMRQGDWKRPITDPSFFLKEKLQWMDKNSIQHGVMLNLSQVYCNGWNKQDAQDAISIAGQRHITLLQDEPRIVNSTPVSGGQQTLGDITAGRAAEPTSSSVCDP